MEQLKAELIQICRERGDEGDHAVHAQTVDAFLESMLIYFTPKGVRSFTAVELREPYVGWVNEFIRTQLREPADEILVCHFWPSSHARKLKPVEQLPANVTSLFKPRA